jgi:hypothetical protein
MNKRIRVLLILSIFAIFFIFFARNTNRQKIGGDTDPYGCMVSAGYFWNGSVGACIREWELDESQRKAANLAIMPLSYRVTVVEVETLRCPGCFIVKLQRNDNRNINTVELNNWTFFWDCEDYPYDNCPERCMVCPSCEFCSSIKCQTEESCKSIGFNKTWYENIKKASEQLEKEKCRWEPGQCKNICTSENYYFDNSTKECKKYADSKNGCCTPPPFEKLEDCKSACE